MPEGQSIGSLLIKIAADTAMLRAGIKQSASDIKGFEKSLGTLKNALIGAFSATAIIAFGKSSLNAFEQAEKSSTKLLTSLKGNTTQLKELQELASKRQSITIFSHEESENAMARMRSLLGDNEEGIKRLLPLVQDLATVKDMDLATAADLVAKSISSSTNALKRQGIVIEGAAGSQERLESAINALTKAFGGQAEAMGGTLYGQMQKTKHAWDDIKESIGSAIAPIVIRSAKAWQYWAEVMNSNVSGWEKFKTTFTSAGELIKKYNAEYETLGDNLERIKKISEIKMNPDGSYMVPNTGVHEQNLPGGSYVGGTPFKRSKIPGSMDWNAPYQFDSSAWNYKPVSQKALAGSSWDDKTGKITNPMPELNFPDMKERWEKNYQAYKDFTDKMKSLSEDMVNIINQGFTDMAAGFAEALGTMLVTGKGFNPSTMLEGLATMLGQLGKMAIAAGIATLGIKKALQSLNGYVAIAAGAALVALSAAIKAGVSNLASGSSTSGAAMSSGSSSGSTPGYNFNRNLGDVRPVTINVKGKIDGNDIRLSYDRSKSQHNNGY